MGVKASMAGTGRRLLTGFNVLLAVVLVIALLAGTNLLVRNPVLRARIDLSPGARFTLSPQTREQVLNLLRDLDQTVKIEAFFSQPPVAEPGHPDKDWWDAQGAIRAQLQDFTAHLLSVYEVESGKRIETRIYAMDREIQASRQAAQRLGLEGRIDPLNDLIVVSAGKRRETFTTLEMGQVHTPEVPLARKRGTPVLAAFTGEEALSSRIRSVLLSSAPKLLFLKGHREIEPDSTGPTGLETLVGLLRQEGFELGVLELRKEARIPADCDILVVLQPQTRLSRAEEEEIRRWLVEDGGRLFVAHGFHEAFPVDLSALVGPVGLGHGSRQILSRVLDRERMGAAVLTGDARALFTLVVDLSNIHPITQLLGRTGAYLEVGNTLAVTAAPTPPPGVATWILATTNPICWEAAPVAPGVNEYLPLPGVSPTESFHVAAAGQVAGPEQGRFSRAVLLGSSEAVRSYFLTERNPANKDFLINAFNWLADRTERVSVSPRTETRRRLAPISPQQATRLELAALVLFPGAVLLAGLVVFLIRRR